MLRMLLASLLISLSGVAGGQQVNCPNGSPADGVHWAGNSHHCVANGATRRPARRVAGRAACRRMPTSPNCAPIPSYGALLGPRMTTRCPKLSEAFVEAMKARGIDTALTYADGANHGSVRRAPEFYALASEMAARLSRSEPPPTNGTGR